MFQNIHLPSLSETARIPSAPQAASRPPFGGSGAAAGPSSPPPVPPVSGAGPGVPPPPPPVPPASGPAWWTSLWHGCLVASFAFTVGFLLLALFAIRGCSSAVSKLGATDPDGEFALVDVPELNLSRKRLPSSAPRVLHVPLRGAIESGGGPAWRAPEAGSAPEALRRIRRATIDSRIDGILLDIDSPGGEVTASDELWKALKDFRDSRQDTQTPRFVVALFGGTAASGAYYAAAAADWIVARPTTLTGSIGVKMSSINVKGLADRYGVKEVSVVSGPDKNLLSPFSDLTEPQRQKLQKQVDALHARFVELVAKGRRMEEARVRELADGRVFLAAEAKEAGLVDEIGYLEDAKAQVSTRLGGATPRYVAYEDDLSVVKALLSPSFVGAALREALPEAPAPSAAPTMALEGM